MNERSRLADPETLNLFDGMRIGHWTDAEARTGCTVIVFDRSALTSVDVRSGAPGTRETDLLRPGQLVQRADAIVLTGGSAFGLASADGVMTVLREAGRGHPTSAGPVPMVPAAVIFDLANGSANWPGPAEGRAALNAAQPIGEVARGGVGAGTGATMAKLWPARMRPGGLGIGVARWGRGAVCATVVINSLGDAVSWLISRDGVDEDDRDGRGDPRLLALAELERTMATGPNPGEATSLIAITLAGSADHATLQRCAVSAHDALARTIVPCHTPFDGDCVFVSTLEEGPRLDARHTLGWCIATEIAVERAIHDAVDSDHRDLG